MAQRTTAQDTARKDGSIVSAPILAAEKIYKGTPIIIKTTWFAFSNDGTTNTLANGDFFGGISNETVDNSTGAAGDKSVNLSTDGIHLLEFSDTLTQANLFDRVYVNNNSDDAVVTITSHSANPQLTIGYIAQFVSANKAYVAIQNYVGTVAANGA